METKKRGDLVINGFGASNGGQFQKVTLNGKGTVNSDIECKEFECNGTGAVKGNIIVETAKINGMAKISGTVEAKDLSVDGTAKIEKNLIVEKVKVAGKATVGGRVKAEEIKIKGKLTVEEDCEAELFKAESMFTIGGLLNADEVDIKIFGDCQAKEIGGQSIVVKYKPSWFGIFKSLFQTQLKVEVIEGDTIYLENTKAAVVRGNHVTIGQNCEIGFIEYTDELAIDPSAVVGENKKR
ncbi:polymer-forming cytoskeletal protein [Neobacillus niacini]|uniref:polymer-forming cytoskeletal protein n=1 Tax=Neobacillus niacini TaxID=86668 RepID=UPI00285BEE3B|nr:polymer-forming cytoskeletal protein [Neobacillus niacini]MDR7002719.1 cytoskeletal protein CcmA (bactofilin family) [Neobacillus niacini]